MNSSVLDQSKDPGKDSDQAGDYALFAKDVFGFALKYYATDYTPIASANSGVAASVNNASHAATNSFDLYNGNIRYMQTAITNPDTRAAMPMLNAYRYDQLNRLKESRSYETGLASNVWNPTTYSDSYYNAFTYDANGNIITQIRHKRDGTKIDDLTYRYHKNLSSGKLVRNRLYHVNDAVAPSVDHTDIDDMTSFYFEVDSININNNYVYDEEGRLVKDKQEGIDTIIWRVDGKVKEIRRSLSSEKKNIIFEYNSFGQRIAKHVKNAQTLMLEKSTYYILDAQGQQLSMYEHTVDTANVNYYLAERNIYGSSRLGVTRDTINMFNPQVLPSYGILGNRNYELNNHLGNVLTVITDQITPLDEDLDEQVDGYQVAIRNTYDYSPFGVHLDGRTMERVIQVCTEVTDTVIMTALDEDFTSGGSWTSRTNTSLTYPLGEMKITKTSTSSPLLIATPLAAYKNFTVDEGEIIVTFDIVSKSCAGAITVSIREADGFSPIYTSHSYSNVGSYSFSFSSLSSGTYSIYFSMTGGSGCTTYTIDNVFIESTNIITDTVCQQHGADYRYGYQSSERDDEVKGAGNSYTTEYRQYDPRLGRWLSLDPLMDNFPWQSPYCAMDNNPIVFNDTEGLNGEDRIKRKAEEFAEEKSGTVIKHKDKDGNISYTVDYLYVEVITAKGLNKSFVTLTRKTKTFTNTKGNKFIALFTDSKWINGKGGETTGGHPLTTKGDAIDPTKFRSKTAGREIDADDLPGIKGNKNTKYFDKVLDVVEALKRAAKVAEPLIPDGSGGGTSDEMKKDDKQSKGVGPAEGDTTITINQWERGYGWTRNHSKDTTVKKSDVDKVERNRELPRAKY